MRRMVGLLLGVLTVSAVAQEGPPVLPDVQLGQGDPVPFTHCRWVPAAARTLRLNDRNWATDLEAVNIGSTAAHLSVALLERDADNRNAYLARLTEPVPPGATVHLPDVVTVVLPSLWRPWLGGLVVCSDGPGLEVFSRSYLLGAGGTITFGQGIPGLSTADAILPGTVGHLFGLREDERFRSHLGLLNPSPVAVHATVRLVDDAGATLITLIHDLQPYSQVQYNSILARFGYGVTTGRAEVTCPVGPVFAYASLIDNASNDPTYIPCRVTAE